MQVFIYCKITLHVSGVLSHPSSGLHQTVTAASGTGHSVGATSASVAFRPRWRMVLAPVHRKATDCE